MILLDSHCHISLEYYEDPLLEVLKLLQRTQLESITIIGTEYQDSFENLELKIQFANVVALQEYKSPITGEIINLREGVNGYMNRTADSIRNFLKVAVGFHPERVISLGKNYYTHELERLLELIETRQQEIDIIGEIGLDTTYPNATEMIEEQIDTFKTFITLANNLKKPISIHTRRATELTKKVIEECIPRQNTISSVVDNNIGLLHCFTGSLDDAEFYLFHGLKLGIGGISTYKSGEGIIEVIKNISEKYSLKFDDFCSLETDSPYLAPEPLPRKEKNSPKNIPLIQEYLRQKGIK